MDKYTNKISTEEESPGRRLEALLLEGLQSGEATPLTRTDFVKIKDRGETRLKAQKNSQNLI